jgi:hypothetical protein
MNETLFELLKKEHIAGGLVRLSYGSSKDDPLPFILTLMPERVARETGKHVATIGPDDMDAYIFEKSADLKLEALAEKDRGRTTTVLN